MPTDKKAIIYNFVGGAGGDGYAAKMHDAPHRITDLGKVKLLDDSHTVMKELVYSRFHDFFDAVMDLPPNDFYVTHDLNLLTDDQLERLDREFEIINIDDKHAHAETFLLNMLKNVLPKRQHDITLVLGGKRLFCRNPHGLSVLELWDEITDSEYPDDIRSRFDIMIQEYRNKQGLFYQQHSAWHSKKYPGRYVKYQEKQRLGTYLVQGLAWDLDHYKALLTDPSVR